MYVKEWSLYLVPIKYQSEIWFLSDHGLRLKLQFCRCNHSSCQRVITILCQGVISVICEGVITFWCKVLFLCQCVITILYKGIITALSKCNHSKAVSMYKHCSLKWCIHSFVSRYSYCTVSKSGIISFCIKM